MSQASSTTEAPIVAYVAPARAEDAGVSRKDIHEQIIHYLESSCVEPSGPQLGFRSLFEQVCLQRSVDEMLQLVRRFDLVTDEAICTAILYMQRFLRTRELALTHDNLRPLFLVAVCIGTKFMDDVTYNNLTFAQLGELPVDLFNALEMEFLQGLRFHLTIDPARLAHIYTAFVSEAQRLLAIAAESAAMQQSPAIHAAAASSYQPVAVAVAPSPALYSSSSSSSSSAYASGASGHSRPQAYQAQTQTQGQGQMQSQSQSQSQTQSLYHTSGPPPSRGSISTPANAAGAAMQVDQSRPRPRSTQRSRK